MVLLPAGQTYKVKAFPATTAGCTDSRFYGPFQTQSDRKSLVRSSVGGAIGGTIAGVLVVVVLVVVILVFIKRKERGYDHLDETTDERLEGFSFQSIRDLFCWRYRDGTSGRTEISQSNASIGVTGHTNPAFVDCELEENNASAFPSDDNFVLRVTQKETEEQSESLSAEENHEM
ncbi:hypothetical protein ScPMuIL_012956 [Solemya velum]